MVDYAQHVSARITPQDQPIPGSTQVPNSAGGYAWAVVDDWTRLDRFLLLGTEGGSYYAGERELTVASAEATRRCLAADGPRVVRRIVDISTAGRAPKNDPAILALALAAAAPDPATRDAALATLPAVCRIGTHLFHFLRDVQTQRGWGRGLRRAVARWYTDTPDQALTYQLLKYRARDGWSHRDALRLAHPRATDPARVALYRWVTGSKKYPAPAEWPPLIAAFERLQASTDPDEAAGLIREWRLPRECVPTPLLTEPRVWQALLDVGMPMTAMLRNLATMTKIGLLRPMGDATATVVAALGDAARLRQARVHPIAVLTAMLTYASGHGLKGSATWSPVREIVDALDRAFYLSFGAVEPIGKPTLLALDISGSMWGGTVAGVAGLTPGLASAAMALVTAATEPRHSFMAFTTQPRSLTISPRQRLDDVAKMMAALPMGRTDCALPMRWALAEGLDVDLFVVYTDSETWAGPVHPAQALRAYREQRGRAAKLAVVGMVSNGFTIADPADPGMLDVVGMDASTPAALHAFAR
jgi:60 kDa SS-A/Ro ribonucleoprotein